MSDEKLVSCAHCGTFANPWCTVFGLPLCSERCFIKWGAAWLREQERDREQTPAERVE